MKSFKCAFKYIDKSYKFIKIFLSKILEKSQLGAITPWAGPNPDCPSSTHMA